MLQSVKLPSASITITINIKYHDILPNPLQPPPRIPLPPTYDIFNIPANTPTSLFSATSATSATQASPLPRSPAPQVHARLPPPSSATTSHIYHSSWADARRRLSAFSHNLAKRAEQDAGLGQFVFLDQTRHDLSENLTVLGCMLHPRVSAE
ncbi:hypothetical protein GX51_04579 [Blastomyces parvus]|uniref:Uncharacterized protein n=1 Tax=Blastomyces parvus TaxID=2060905 RepID=A0A2B7X1D7_9EURO|nr:hypothetical protein GX51_04579 [Blastomyces parvus]